MNDIHEHGHPWSVRTPLLVNSTRENIRRDPHQLFPQKSWREANASNGPMSTVHHKDLNISPCKNKSNRCYLTALWRNNYPDVKSFLRAVWQAPSWTLYSVMRRNLTFNRIITDRRIGFCLRLDQMQTVIQRQAQAAAS